MYTNIKVKSIYWDCVRKCSQHKGTLVFNSLSLSFSFPLSSLSPSLQPSLPALDNPLSFRVRGICAHLQATRQLQLKVKILRSPSNFFADLVVF